MKDGNLMMCAANDVNVNAKITLTNGSLIPSQSLGLPRGLTLLADSDGTGPGIAGGTVIFAPLAPPASVTNAPVTVFYNPVSYTTPTDYATKFILTEGAELTRFMLVFPDGANKPFDGTTAATLNSLKGNPDGVNLVVSPGSSARFDSADVGSDKNIVFSNYSLGGPQAGNFAFATACCGPALQRTTGSISPSLVAIVASASASAMAKPQVLASTGGMPQVGMPQVIASLEAPPNMVFAETPEAVQAVPEEAEAPKPIPFVAPVRPRKQGRQ
jgi:hypothetical protein